MPTRNEIVVSIPSIDRRVDVGCIGGLLQTCHLYHHTDFFCGNSDIALARNEIAHRFVEYSDFPWLVMIDSDIEFNPSDWELLWEGDEDIVTCAYSKKIIGEKPAEYGLGFTRVHRSVFERLRDLRMEDGKEALPRFYLKGDVMCAYFTSGPSHDSRWVGEDKSFFIRASLLNGCTCRVERRTTLRHIGAFPFHYPEQIPRSVIGKFIPRDEYDAIDDSDKTVGQ